MASLTSYSQTSTSLNSPHHIFLHRFSKVFYFLYTLVLTTSDNGDYKHQFEHVILFFFTRLNSTVAQSYKIVLNSHNFSSFSKTQRYRVHGHRELFSIQHNVLFFIVTHYYLIISSC
ncbi:hypothetical protein O6H91_Y560500 [Diphasiastrum complanatum]|nr:hypothetical protein O6H91_Y560500 [Diphasiastrum complanatum]